MLLDARWMGTEHGWLVSSELYRDDLAPEPTAIRVYGYRPTILQILGQLKDELESLCEGSPLTDGGETLDLRDPGQR